MSLCQETKHPRLWFLPFLRAVFKLPGATNNLSGVFSDNLPPKMNCYCLLKTARLDFFFHKETTDLQPSGCLKSWWSLELQLGLVAFNWASTGVAQSGTEWSNPEEHTGVWHRREQGHWMGHNLLIWSQFGIQFEPHLDMKVYYTHIGFPFYCYWDEGKEGCGPCHTCYRTCEVLL